MRKLTPNTKITINQLRNLLIYYILENSLTIDTREDGAISPDGTKEKKGDHWEYIPKGEQETSRIDAEGRKFVTTPSGSLIFGNITEETARKMGTNVAAPIKLSEGNYEYGKKHLETWHWNELMSRYDSVEEFVEDIAKNFTDVYKSKEIKNEKGEITRSTFILARKTYSGILYIELKYTNDEPYYSVNSGGWYKPKKKKTKAQSHSKRVHKNKL